ncbi:phage tail length tape measure family protein [Pseudomonas aeruginosa]|nr:phage tail length tape measure family protein [Pseudomonas aeruginosa]
MADTANTTAEAAEKTPRERFQGWGVLAAHLPSLQRHAAAAVALAYAYKKGSDEASELNESIILTGNYAGTSAVGSWQRWPHRLPSERYTVRSCGRAVGDHFHR